MRSWQTDLIVEGIDKLQHQAASTAFVLNNGKFKQEGRFDMAYGALALFYGGLEALIGPPTMVDGSLIKSMEQVCGTARNAARGGDRSAAREMRRGAARSAARSQNVGGRM